MLINSNNTPIVLRANDSLDYSPNMDCVWLVIGPQNSSVSLTMNRLDISSSTSCVTDWLSVTTSSVSGGFYNAVKSCGAPSLPLSYISPGRYMWVHFHSSNTSGNSSGFASRGGLAGNITFSPSGEIAFFFF